MDLNSALDELGMLSSVTESRKDFLKERDTQKQAQDCFQVVHLNTQYVTCMGPVLRSHRSKRNMQSNTADIEEAAVSLRAAKPEPDMNVGDGRVARYRRTRAKYAKPYRVPGRARQRRITEPSDGAETSATISSDAAISNGFHIPSGVSVRALSRSKSMDELEFKQQNANNHSKSTHNSVGREMKQDNVEVVAKHMKDLKVK